MQHSTQPTLAEIRPVTRLLMEVLDLERDGKSWKQHLATGLCVAFGAREGTVARFAEWGPDSKVCIVEAVGGGWPAPLAARLLMDFHTTYPPRTDPILDELTKLSGPVQAHRVSQLVGLERFFRSTAYEVTGSQMSQGDSLAGWHLRREPGQVTGLVLHRARSDHPFSERERNLFQFCMEELCHMHQRGMIDGPLPLPLPDMPPRERQIMRLLLEAKAWKEIARELNLSRHTVDGYAKSLFKRLGIHSRAELAARFGQFRGR